jgi:hypothetical protein
MEQRRTRRFQLNLPLSITRSGPDRVSLAGVTKNISSSGVLFSMEGDPDLGGPIEYVITLNHEGPQAVNLRCIGKIIRAGRVPSETDRRQLTSQIAVTLERYEFVRERGMAR